MLPAPAERAGEPCGRVVAAPQAPVAVGRDIGDDVCRRPRHALGDELGGEARERAETALLPRRRNGRAGPRVGDGRAGRGERDPPPGALAAALDRPRRRGAAARAERRTDRPRARRGRRAQKSGPGSPQETQREGSRSSRGHADHGRAEAVTCLCQLCARFVTAGAGASGVAGEYSVARRVARAGRAVAGCRPRAAAPGRRCRATPR